MLMACQVTIRGSGDKVVVVVVVVGVFWWHAVGREVLAPTGTNQPFSVIAIIPVCAFAFSICC